MMQSIRRTLFLGLPSGALLAASSLSAQSLPPVRPIGEVTKVSAAGMLGSVSYVRALPSGNLIVSDVLRAEVSLLNNNLEKVKAIYDSTTDSWAGRLFPMGAILAFKADSTLFIDVRALSMLVLDENGNVARVMAVPSPADTPSLRGGPYGTPAHDPQGRLVFRAGVPTSRREETQATIHVWASDSAPLFRIDLATRSKETLTYVKIRPQRSVGVKDKSDWLGAVTSYTNEFAIVDDWALLPDGRVAVIRGRDYHVDWLELDGHWHASAKVPFAWQRLDDEAKVRLVDSVNTAIDSARRAALARDSVESTKKNQTKPRASLLQWRPAMVPAKELADYRPAFKEGATRVDLDGNLWIRTTTPNAKGPIYDVVNSKGELSDRVQLPFGRVISGFGRGVVYMGVLDDVGARLEVALLR